MCLHLYTVVSCIWVYTYYELFDEDRLRVSYKAHRARWNMMILNPTQASCTAVPLGVRVVAGVRVGARGAGS